jgi:hypothetical protein
MDRKNNTYQSRYHFAIGDITGTTAIESVTMDGRMTYTLSGSEQPCNPAGIRPIDTICAQTTGEAGGLG